MKTYFDRQEKKLQIILPENTNINEFTEIKIVVSRGDPSNGITIYQGLPSLSYYIDYTFSTNTALDIFAIGINSTGEILIDVSPIVQNISSYHKIMIEESQKMKLQRQRALMVRGEDVVLYLYQGGNNCSCFDVAYGLPQKTCSICGGTGIINMFLGIPIKIKLDDNQSWQYDYKPTGEVIVKQINNCWSLPFPYLTSKDIIERKNGEMFKIQKTLDEFLSGAGILISQEFNLINIQDYQETQGFKIQKTLHKNTAEKIDKYSF